MDTDVEALKARIDTLMAQNAELWVENRDLSSKLAAANRHIQMHAGDTISLSGDADREHEARVEAEARAERLERERDNAVLNLTNIAKAQQARAKRAEKALREAEAECEHMMSRADHQKKHALMDNHTSEICHQEGRWHCANDLLSWVSETRAALSKAEEGSHD